MSGEILESRFYGVIPPLITPFNEDLSVDVEGLRWLVRYLVERGVHGIFANSTTGEFVHLSRDEAVMITRIVLEEVGGRVWVISGVSANYTEDCVSLGRVFADLGVSGIIATPPYFFKVSAESLKKHYSTIAERVDLPLIIYNIPSTTGVNIPIRLYVELAREHSNVVGAKITYDGFSYLRSLVQEVREVRRDFSILTGLDDMLLPTLMMGGSGGIMALANVAPQIHREVYDSWTARELDRAVESWRRLLELTRAYDYATSYPSVVKTMLRLLGAPIKPIVRPPLEPEPPETEKRLREIIERLGLRI